MASTIPGMSTPRLPVSSDVDVDPLEAAVVEEQAQSTWPVKPSEPHWDRWKDADRLRRPTQAELRNRVAARIATRILGVLGIAGALVYGVRYAALFGSATTQIQAEGGVYALAGRIEWQAGSGLQNAIDNQLPLPAGTGLIGVVNGAETGKSQAAAHAAADRTFIAEAVENSTTNGFAARPANSYVSLSTVCVYSAEKIDGSAIVIYVSDLTPELTRMNVGFLGYGLVSLGLAGVVAGRTWRRLGRELDSKVEPDDV